ncbi:KR domain-containing protein [Micromonospora tarensis]|uniref:SDR family oxidoreductase n=1 Tax=Micromonospora tarensis TaxID=2806100 RepID=A0ABS1YF77_9ACTN|nr:KR domain-containing protein [Micromonospora tarensis]MBM0276002.1 SDR family oxidoreductase [Micromonospora tarensis]
MSEPILRQVLTLAPLPSAPPPPANALDGRLVLVLGGTPALRASIDAAVGRLGGRACGWQAEQGRPDVPGPVDAIVDAGVLGSTDVTAGSWREPMARTVAALRYVYDDWSREASADRLHYLAVTGMGGTMGLAAADGAQPLSGLWAGLAKTLPREFPACDVRVCDLGPTADPGAALLAEMLGTRLLEVGVGDGQRQTILPRKAAVDGAPIRLADTDVVLLTGGGRGIGFEIALDLAQRFGCRVMVSGRTALPDAHLPWLTCSDAEFDEENRLAFQRRQPGESLQQVRRGVRGRRQAREIWRNLRRAREAGADVTYHVCDVSDPNEVADLVAKAGDALTYVIHNAGIDAPARLPAKSTDQFLAVIDVKVDGFLHLLSAIGDRPLKMLCAVGSLTGRYGGMVGQLDYASANEGLARLAMWAGQRLPYPVKSLSWPTWDGLGLITNLDAAARYMTPIPVSEGVDAWRAELTRHGHGEIGFMGEIGEVSPQHLRGIVVPSDWSGRSRLLTMRFLLGELVRYAPPGELRTEHQLDTGWASCLNDTMVDDTPVLPVSLAVEYLVAAAAWLTPPGAEQLDVHCLADVRVDPGRLRALDGHLTLRREARGGWHGDAWQVQVGLSTVGDEDEAFAAEATVLFGVGRPTPPAPPQPADEGVEAGPPVRAAVGYRWSPYLTDVGPWDRTPAGWTADVAAAPTDWFTVLEPPQARLPLAHLEALVAVSPEDGDRQWRVDRLWLAEGGVPDRVTRSVDGRVVGVSDPDGRTLVLLEGAAWHAS